MLKLGTAAGAVLTGGAGHAASAAPAPTSARPRFAPLPRQAKPLPTGPDGYRLDRKVTEKPVSHLIYTHQHADHIANARVFGDVVRVVHAETARLIHNEQDSARPMPTVTFKDQYTLTVGDQQLELSSEVRCVLL
jgi:hypothetical protein